MITLGKMNYTRAQLVSTVQICKSNKIIDTSDTSDLLGLKFLDVALSSYC